MSRETKMMKVYAEDWEFLNNLLGVLQAHRRERLSLADTLHMVLQVWGNQVGKDISDWIKRIWEHLPEEFKEALMSDVQ